MNKSPEFITAKKEGYRIELEAFSGPLELLLNLIKTQEIDIYNIPIARITEQYLEYLKLMEVLNLDMAGEFLVMASTLMLIKSRLLLPQELGSSEEEENDPRAELVAALLEYKQYKEAAGRLGELAVRREEIFNRGEESLFEKESENILETDLSGLISAFRKVLEQIGPDTLTEITRSTHTVKEKIRELLNFTSQRKEFSFSELFHNISSRVEAVVCFLAILELIKQKKILARQNRAFGEIIILKRENEFKRS